MVSVNIVVWVNWRCWKTHLDFNHGFLRSERLSCYARNGLADYCAHGVAYKDQRDGAGVTEVGNDGLCDPRTLGFSISAPVEGNRAITPRTCGCNFQVALRNRVIMRVGRPDIQVIRALATFSFNHCKYYLHQLHVERPKPFSRWCSKYSQAKQKRLQEAGESLLSYPLTSLDARITAFVKREVLICKDEDDYDTPIQDPRLIQYRGDRYAVVIVPWISALEDKLQLDFSSRKFTFKGSSYDEKGMIYQGILDQFEDPVVAEIDFSRFDATLNESLDFATEMIAYSVLLDAPPDFYRALAYQLQPVQARSQNGTKYVTHGNRFSGEYNTSCGNCFVNYLTMAFVMHSSGVSKWRCLVEGDDNVCMMERCDYSRVLWDLYSDMGLKITLAMKEPDTAEFCSGWFMKNSHGRQFVRLPKNVLTKTPFSLGCPSLRQVPKYLRSVALCERHSNAGVPVLMAYARYLHRCAERFLIPGIAFDKDVYWRYLQVQNMGDRSVDEVSYEHFSRFTGIPVSNLKECEEYLDGCDIYTRVLTHPVLKRLIE